VLFVVAVAVVEPPAVDDIALVAVVVGFPAVVALLLLLPLLMSAGVELLLSLLTLKFELLQMLFSFSPPLSF
jgi:hypothetical protein